MHTWIAPERSDLDSIYGRNKLSTTATRVGSQHENKCALRSDNQVAGSQRSRYKGISHSRDHFYMPEQRTFTRQG